MCLQVASFRAWGDDDFVDHLLDARQPDDRLLGELLLVEARQPASKAKQTSVSTPPGSSRAHCQGGDAALTSWASYLAIVMDVWHFSLVSLL